MRGRRPGELCSRRAARTLSTGPLVLFPTGAIDRGTAPTRFRWQGAPGAFAHRGETPAQGEGHASPG